MIRETLFRCRSHRSGFDTSNIARKTLQPAASVNTNAPQRPGIPNTAAAESGDVVLMAPATSSFDLYANYMARGDDFRRVVESLRAAPGQGA